jgi:hypothetical protein
VVLVRHARKYLKTKTDSRAEIDYHNNAIYKDFEFFFKVTLANVGGLLFLVTREPSSSICHSNVLISMAQLLQIMTALLFSFFIFCHQKSKIKRWKEPYPYSSIFFDWQETWMIFTIGTLSGAIFSLATALR